MKGEAIHGSEAGAWRMETTREERALLLAVLKAWDPKKPEGRATPGFLSLPKASWNEDPFIALIYPPSALCLGDFYSSFKACSNIPSPRKPSLTPRQSWLHLPWAPTAPGRTRLSTSHIIWPPLTNLSPHAHCQCLEGRD